MTRFMSIDPEHSRDTAAREEFIGKYMMDVPPVYRAILPVIRDGKVLLEAEKAIREMWKIDAEAYQAELRNPWKTVTGNWSGMIDWSEVDSKNMVGLGMLGNRGVGMPAPVKPGKDPEGVLYNEYPVVNEAVEKAFQTAEYVAFEAVKQAMEDLKPVSREHLLAFNALADAKTEARTGKKIEKKYWKSGDKVPTELELEQLEKAKNSAEENLAKAQAEFNRLRANPVEGLRIVR